MKTCLLRIALFLFVAGVAFGAPVTPLKIVRPPRIPVDPATAVKPAPRPSISPLADEALRQVWPHAESVFIKKGERWFTRSMSVILEARFVYTHILRVNPLTPEDKSKGVEWSGTVRLSSGISRRQTSAGSWDEWTNGFLWEIYSAYDYQVTKVRGEWKIEGNALRWLKKPVMAESEIDH